MHRFLIDIINIFKINYEPLIVKVICCMEFKNVATRFIPFIVQMPHFIGFSNAYNMNFIFIFSAHIQLITSFASI